MDGTGSFGSMTFTTLPLTLVPQGLAQEGGILCSGMRSRRSNAHRILTICLLIPIIVLSLLDGTYERCCLGSDPALLSVYMNLFHQAELSEEEEVVAEWLIERGLPYWAVAAAVHTGERLEFLEERQKISADFKTAIHA